MSNWKVEGGEVYELNESGCYIWSANVSSKKIDDRERYRIARLMYAAPEMLEFIKLLEGDSLKYQEDFEAAKAIIKKIEGGE